MRFATLPMPGLPTLLRFPLLHNNSPKGSKLLLLLNFSKHMTLEKRWRKSSEVVQTYCKKID